MFLNDYEKSDSRIAALNSLRRVVIHYIDSKWYYRPSTSLPSIKIVQPGDDDQLDSNSSSNSSKQQELKRHEYNIWFQKQFVSIQSFLLQLLSHEDDVYQAVAIRTYIEFMKYDSLIQNGPTVVSSSFNEETWKSFIIAILISRKELDVDLLLMIKQEILIFHDFTYYSFSILIDMIAEIKLIHQQYLDKVIIMGSAIEYTSTDIYSIVANNYQVICQNCIDFLRILSVPELIDRTNMWIPLSTSKNNNLTSKKKKGKDMNKGKDTKKDINDNKTTMLSDSDSDLDEYPEIDENSNNNEYGREVKKIDPLVAELAGLNRNNKKRKVDSKVPMKMMKKSIHEEMITIEQRLTDIIYYKKGFSKAWLMLLSLSFTSQQHKLILKHLPEHIIPNMRNPMLLADYLTQSYAIGGIVAILSLEGLFFLILNYNLDYPDFFLSLYNLCTIEVFSAKYRSKFMKLLSTSLKSVNIPVYLVCAFIKRLAHLALHTPSPNTQYYIAQITWLLRQHPQSRVLIHRTTTTESSSVDVNDDINPDHHHNDGDFNNMESTNLLHSNAFQSSLWEIDSLQNHHLYQVATLAEALTQPLSTTVGPEAGTSYIHVEDYLNISYSDLIEKELATATTTTTTSSKATTKKNASLAYKRPVSLFAADNIISKCFQVG